MQEITYQIHWLSFTVHAPREDAIKIYENPVFVAYNSAPGRNGSWTEL